MEDITRELEPHRGGTILALGILGLVVCFPLGFVAWFMGKNDVEAMNAGRMDPDGRVLVDAGRICGLIGAILGSIGILFGVVWIVCVMASIGASTAGG